MSKLKLAFYSIRTLVLKCNFLATPPVPPPPSPPPPNSPPLKELLLSIRPLNPSSNKASDAPAPPPPRKEYTTEERYGPNPIIPRAPEIPKVPELPFLEQLGRKGAWRPEPKLLPLFIDMMDFPFVWLGLRRGCAPVPRRFRRFFIPFINRIIDYLDTPITIYLIVVNFFDSPPPDFHRPKPKPVPKFYTKYLVKLYLLLPTPHDPRLDLIPGPAVQGNIFKRTLCKINWYFKPKPKPKYTLSYRIYSRFHFKLYLKFDPKLDPKLNPNYDPELDLTLDYMYEPMLRPEYEPWRDPIFKHMLKPIYKPMLDPVNNLELYPDYEWVTHKYAVIILYSYVFILACMFGVYDGPTLFSFFFYLFIFYGIANLYSMVILEPYFDLDALLAFCIMLFIVCFGTFVFLHMLWVDLDETFLFVRFLKILMYASSGFFIVLVLNVENDHRDYEDPFDP